MRRLHDGGEDAVAHAGTIPLNTAGQPAEQLTVQAIFMFFRACPLAWCLLAWLPSAAFAQPYQDSKPRRQFISVTIDWLNTQPLHFVEHPLEDLLGTAVAEAQFQNYDYETRDGLTRIDVIEFKRRGRGAGVTLYPFGISVGSTLGIRASVEQLPTIQVSFDGPGSLDSYRLLDARAYDVGLGYFVADRSAGWGLGSRAFVIAGAGGIRSNLGNGTRVFAEGGGGLSSGPFGVELSIKFAWNRLDEPVPHKFLTIPVALRGTVSF